MAYIRVVGGSAGFTNNWLASLQVPSHGFSGWPILTTQTVSPSAGASNINHFQGGESGISVASYMPNMVNMRNYTYIYHLSSM